MRFDLKKPCKNCPFNKADTRIVFACRERAEEIEEQAYRQGFPCHLSAVFDEDKEDAGFEPGPNTQHCAGAFILYLNESEYGWPAIDNDEELAAKLEKQTQGNRHLVFDSIEDFLSANEPKNHPRHKSNKRRKKKTLTR